MLRRVLELLVVALAACEASFSEGAAFRREARGPDLTIGSLLLQYKWSVSFLTTAARDCSSEPFFTSDAWRTRPMKTFTDAVIVMLHDI